MDQGLLPYAVIQYIIERERELKDKSREIKLPRMEELADRLGVSRGKLREELIAAQAYGIVEMRPGDGTYVRPFDFYTPARTMVLYGVERDRRSFDRFYRVRVHLEAAFWEEAARALGEDEIAELERIIERAEEKLQGAPVEIPHDEHREFHLLLFSKIQNEYVQGLLKAYWDAYEAVGLNRYFEYSYYESMWDSHRAMVDAIREGRYEEGERELTEHFTLLQDRLQGEQ